MEGKGVRAPFTVVIMGVLILGLVVAQIEAKVCCRNTGARQCYNSCRPKPACANFCDCIFIGGGIRCPPSHPHSSMLENSDDDVIEQVTTDLEASRRGPILICPNIIAQNCFDKCRAAPVICARNCGCIYIPPRLDLN